MDVAIVGPGAIGLGLAASLGRAGHRVALYGRRSHAGFDHTFDGATVRHAVPVRADVDEATPAGWVLLTTKAYQTRAAAPWLARLARDGSVLAVIQNGVDHVARVRDLWAGEVLPAILSMPSHRTGPTSAHQRRVGSLVVPAGPRGDELASLFDERVTVRTTDDFVTEAWTKLLTNATLGACAVVGQANGAMLSAPLRDLGEGMIREIARVGRAEGAAFTDVEALVEATVARIAKNPEHRSSITEDRLAERPMEWDARNEVVVRTAARHGIDVPLNLAIARLLATLDGAAS